MIAMQDLIIQYTYDTKKSETKIRWLKRESKPCVSTLAVHILNINCTRERALPTCLATAYNHKYSESHLTKLSKEAKQGKKQ